MFSKITIVNFYMLKIYLYKNTTYASFLTIFLSFSGIMPVKAQLKRFCVFLFRSLRNAFAFLFFDHCKGFVEAFCSYDYLVFGLDICF